jgi:hypothetical protein
MKRQHFTTAAALLGLGLFCGCASTTASNNSCGEPREGLFSRWFGNRNHDNCECVETGHVTVGEGPILPDPGYGAPGVPVTTPLFPTMPPPTAITVPNGNPLAQPIPASPESRIKEAGK